MILLYKYRPCFFSDGVLTDYSIRLKANSIPIQAKPETKNDH